MTEDWTQTEPQISDTPITAPNEVIAPARTKRPGLLLVLILAICALVISQVVLNQQISTLERATDAELAKTDEAAKLSEPSLFKAPDDLASLIKKVGASVVDIYCDSGDGSGGTGFAYDDEPLTAGYQTTIVTSHHIIEECWDNESEVTVYLGDTYETEISGLIVGVDEENDLALIEIREVVPLILEAEDFAEPGWWSMAIGNPYDDDLEEVLNRYVSVGYIGYVLDGYYNYTSATLNRGNSGGPLVNNRGELIGINTFASSGLDEGVWNIAVDSDILCKKLYECKDD